MSGENEREPSSRQYSANDCYSTCFYKILDLHHLPVWSKRKETFQRRKQIHEHWSNPESEPLSGLTEDELFDAVISEFSEHVKVASDRFIEQFDSTDMAYNIASFEANLAHDLAQEIVFDPDLNVLSQTTYYFSKLSPETTNSLLLSLHDYPFPEIRSKKVYDKKTPCETCWLEYRSCDVGLAKFSPLKQRNISCCL